MKPCRLRTFLKKDHPMTSKVIRGRKIAGWLTLLAVLCLAAYRIGFALPSPILNPEEASRIADGR